MAAGVLAGAKKTPHCPHWLELPQNHMGGAFLAMPEEMSLSPPNAQHLPVARSRPAA